MDHNNEVYEVYMIVYEVMDTDSGHAACGVYKHDVNTIATYATRDEASQVATNLRRFMGGCGYDVHARVVRQLDYV